MPFWQCKGLLVSSTISQLSDHEEQEFFALLSVVVVSLSYIHNARINGDKTPPNTLPPKTNTQYRSLNTHNDWTQRKCSQDTHAHTSIVLISNLLISMIRSRTQYLYTSLSGYFTEHMLASKRCISLYSIHIHVIGICDRSIYIYIYIYCNRNKGANVLLAYARFYIVPFLFLELLCPKSTLPQND